MQPVNQDAIVQTITRDALHAKIERGDDFALVEVLPSQAYDKYHLPGAINIPLGDDFERKAQLALRDKNRPVVVYSSDESSAASPIAAKKLKDLGYRHVADYVFGKADWVRGGIELDQLDEG